MQCHALQSRESFYSSMLSADKVLAVLNLTDHGSDQCKRLSTDRCRPRSQAQSSYVQSGRYDSAYTHINRITGFGIHLGTLSIMMVLIG